MREVTPDVEIIDFSGLSIDKIKTLVDQNIKKIYYGYRRCYFGELDELINPNISLDEMIEFIKKMRKTPHESPLEHVSMTFHIYNVSRSLTHQLVRHRLASYSQVSQRYTRPNDLAVITPDSIRFNSDPHCYETYEKVMNQIETAYQYFLTCGIKPEDARSILPNATATAIVMTMNFRELLHFFSERCCLRAQEEIRMVATKMLAMCKEYYPCVFDTSGPKCLMLHRCPEHKPCDSKPFKQN